VPAWPSPFTSAARKDPRSKPYFDRFGALGDYPHFLLAGIARRSSGGQREYVYVHAKAGVIDDYWATIGSCNIGARSFFGDTELNVSFVCEETARKFRADLFAEHLMLNTHSMDGVEASRRYQQIARENTAKLATQEMPEELVFALDPKTYAT
jgi:phosphatidylserine/phosphatidylglycerophosphate/cardiolipin synthase-like enzyme